MLTEEQIWWIKHGHLSMNFQLLIFVYGFISQIKWFTVEITR